MFKYTDDDRSPLVPFRTSTRLSSVVTTRSGTPYTSPARGATQVSRPVCPPPTVRHTTMTPNDSPRPTNPEFRVELFVRSLAPSGAYERQKRIVDRLSRLSTAKHVVSVSSTVWGNRICPEAALRLSTGRSILEDIERVRTWADQHDASLDPFFDEYEVQTMTERSYTVIVPPVICLAVSAGDDLWGVFPYAKDGETYTVADGLDLIENADPVPADPFAEPSSLES